MLHKSMRLLVFFLLSHFAVPSLSQLLRRAQAASATSSSSATATSTSTATSSGSSSATGTATASSSATATATRTLTATGTTSAAPTATGTATGAPTVSAKASASPPASRSAPARPSDAARASTAPSDVFTRSGSGSPSVSPSASVSPSGVPSPSSFPTPPDQPLLRAAAASLSFRLSLRFGSPAALAAGARVLDAAALPATTAAAAALGAAAGGGNGTSGDGGGGAPWWGGAATAALWAGAGGALSWADVDALRANSSDSLGGGQPVLQHLPAQGGAFVVEAWALLGGGGGSGAPLLGRSPWADVGDVGARWARPGGAALGAGDGRGGWLFPFAGGGAATGSGGAGCGLRLAPGGPPNVTLRGFPTSALLALEPQSPPLHVVACAPAPLAGGNATGALPWALLPPGALRPGYVYFPSLAPPAGGALGWAPSPAACAAGAAALPPGAPALPAPSQPWDAQGSAARDVEPLPFPPAPLAAPPILAHAPPLGGSLSVAPASGYHLDPFTVATVGWLALDDAALSAGVPFTPTATAAGAAAAWLWPPPPPRLLTPLLNAAAGQGLGAEWTAATAAPASVYDACASWCAAEDALGSGTLVFLSGVGVGVGGGGGAPLSACAAAAAPLLAAAQAPAPAPSALRTSAVALCVAAGEALVGVLAATVAGTLPPPAAAALSISYRLDAANASGPLGCADDAGVTAGAWVPPWLLRAAAARGGPLASPDRWPGFALTALGGAAYPAAATVALAPGVPFPFLPGTHRGTPVGMDGSPVAVRVVALAVDGFGGVGAACGVASVSLTPQTPPASAPDVRSYLVSRGADAEVAARSGCDPPVACLMQALQAAAALLTLNATTDAAPPSVDSSQADVRDARVKSLLALAAFGGAVVGKRAPGELRGAGLNAPSPAHVAPLDAGAAAAAAGALVILTTPPGADASGALPHVYMRAPLGALGVEAALAAAAALGRALAPWEDWVAAGVAPGGSALDPPPPLPDGPPHRAVTDALAAAVANALLHVAAADSAPAHLIYAPPALAAGAPWGTGVSASTAAALRAAVAAIGGALTRGDTPLPAGGAFFGNASGVPGAPLPSAAAAVAAAVSSPAALCGRAGGLTIAAARLLAGSGVGANGSDGALGAHALVFPPAPGCPGGSGAVVALPPALVAAVADAAGLAALGSGSVTARGVVLSAAQWVVAPVAPTAGLGDPVAVGVGGLPFPGGGAAAPPACATAEHARSTLGLPPPPRVEDVLPWRPPDTAPLTVGLATPTGALLPVPPPAATFPVRFSLPFADPALGAAAGSASPLPDAGSAEPPAYLPFSALAGGGGPATPVAARGAATAPAAAFAPPRLRFTCPAAPAAAGVLLPATSPDTPPNVTLPAVRVVASWNFSAGLPALTAGEPAPWLASAPAALAPLLPAAPPALTLALTLAPAVATMLSVDCGAGAGGASAGARWAAPANVTCGPGFEGVEVEFRCPAPVATPTCLLAAWGGGGGGGGAAWGAAAGCAPRGLPAGGAFFCDCAAGGALGGGAVAARLAAVMDPGPRSSEGGLFATTWPPRSAPGRRLPGSAAVLLAAGVAVGMALLAAGAGAAADARPALRFYAALAGDEGLSLAAVLKALRGEPPVVDAAGVDAELFKAVASGAWAAWRSGSGGSDPSDAARLYAAHFEAPVSRPGTPSAGGAVAASSGALPMLLDEVPPRGGAHAVLASVLGDGAARLFAPSTHDGGGDLTSQALALHYGLSRPQAAALQEAVWRGRQRAAARGGGGWRGAAWLCGVARGKRAPPQPPPADPSSLDPAPLTLLLLLTAATEHLRASRDALALGWPEGGGGGGDGGGGDALLSPASPGGLQSPTGTGRWDAPTLLAALDDRVAATLRRAVLPPHAQAPLLRSPVRTRWLAAAGQEELEDGWRGEEEEGGEGGSVFTRETPAEFFAAPPREAWGEPPPSSSAGGGTARTSLTVTSVGSDGRMRRGGVGLPPAGGDGDDEEEAAFQAQWVLDQRVAAAEIADAMRGSSRRRGGGKGTPRPARGARYEDDADDGEGGDGVEEGESDMDLAEDVDAVVRMMSPPFPRSQQRRPRGEAAASPEERAPHRPNGGEGDVYATPRGAHSAVNHHPAWRSPGAHPNAHHRVPPPHYDDPLSPHRGHPHLDGGVHAPTPRPPLAALPPSPAPAPALRRPAGGGDGDGDGDGDGGASAPITGADLHAFATAAHGVLRCLSELGVGDAPRPAVDSFSGLPFSILRRARGDSRGGEGAPPVAAQRPPRPAPRGASRALLPCLRLPAPLRAPLLCAALCVCGREGVLSRYRRAAPLLHALACARATRAPLSAPLTCGWGAYHPAYPRPLRALVGVFGALTLLAAAALAVALLRPLGAATGGGGTQAYPLGPTLTLSAGANAGALAAAARSGPALAALARLVTASAGALPLLSHANASALGGALTGACPLAFLPPTAAGGEPLVALSPPPLSASEGLLAALLALLLASPALLLAFAAAEAWGQRAMDARYALLAGECSELAGGGGGGGAGGGAPPPPPSAVAKGGPWLRELLAVGGPGGLAPLGGGGGGGGGVVASVRLLRSRARALVYVACVPGSLWAAACAAWASFSGALAASDRDGAAVVAVAAGAGAVGALLVWPVAVYAAVFCRVLVEPTCELHVAAADEDLARAAKREAVGRPAGALLLEAGAGRGGGARGGRLRDGGGAGAAAGGSARAPRAPPWSSPAAAAAAAAASSARLAESLYGRSPAWARSGGGGGGGGGAAAAPPPPPHRRPPPPGALLPQPAFAPRLCCGLCACLARVRRARCCPASAALCAPSPIAPPSAAQVAALAAEKAAADPAAAPLTPLAAMGLSARLRALVLPRAVGYANGAPPEGGALSYAPLAVVPELLGWGCGGGGGARLAGLLPPAGGARARRAVGYPMEGPRAERDEGAAPPPPPTAAVRFGGVSSHPAPPGGDAAAGPAGEAMRAALWARAVAAARVAVGDSGWDDDNETHGGAAPNVGGGGYESPEEARAAAHAAAAAAAALARALELEEEAAAARARGEDAAAVAAAARAAARADEEAAAAADAARGPPRRKRPPQHTYLLPTEAFASASRASAAARAALAERKRAAAEEGARLAAEAAAARAERAGRGGARAALRSPPPPPRRARSASAAPSSSPYGSPPAATGARRARGGARARAASAREPQVPRAAGAAGSGGAGSRGPSPAASLERESEAGGGGGPPPRTPPQPAAAGALLGARAARAALLLSLPGAPSHGEVGLGLGYGAPSYGEPPPSAREAGDDLLVGSSQLLAPAGAEEPRLLAAAARGGASLTPSRIPRSVSPALSSPLRSGGGPLSASAAAYAAWVRSGDEGAPAAAAAAAAPAGAAPRGRPLDWSADHPPAGGSAASPHRPASARSVRSRASSRRSASPRAPPRLAYSVRAGGGAFPTPAQRAAAAAAAAAAGAEDGSGGARGGVLARAGLAAVAAPNRRSRVVYDP
jgi:hypothetical protein